MAFMIKEITDLRGILFLMLLTIPSKATNLDCYGKAFHCVNSTHFMICVDLGRGISTTIDDVIIPCPSPTVCEHTNRFECEFLTPSELAPDVNTVMNTQMTESEVSTFIPFVTTSIPFEEYYNTLSANTLPANERNSFTMDSNSAVEPVTMGLDTKKVSPTETAVPNLISVDVNVKPKPTNVNLVGSIKASDANGSNVENVTLNLRIILNDTTSAKNIEQSTTSTVTPEVTTRSPILNIEKNNETSVNEVIEEQLTTENVIIKKFQIGSINAKATIVSDVTEPISTTEKFTTIFEEPLTESIVTNYIFSDASNPPTPTEKMLANDFVQPFLHTESTILTSALTEQIVVTTEKIITDFGDTLMNATGSNIVTVSNNEIVTTEETITNTFLQSSKNSTSDPTTTSTNKPTLMTEQVFNKDFQEPLINTKENNFIMNLNKEIDAPENITDTFIQLSTIGPSSANTGVVTEETFTTTEVITKQAEENLETVLNASDVTTVNPIQTAQPITSGSNEMKYTENESIATMNLESVTNNALVSNHKPNTFTTQTFLPNAVDNNFNYETSSDLITTEPTAVNISNDQYPFKITTTTEPVVTTNLPVNEKVINELKLQTNKTNDTTASLSDSSVTTKTETNIFTSHRQLENNLTDVNNNSNNTNHITKTKTTATSENYEEISSVHTIAVTEPTLFITSQKNLEMVATVDFVTTATVSEKTFSADSPKVYENLELTPNIAPKSNTVPVVVKKLETIENVSNTTSTLILESTTENIVNTLQSDPEKIITKDLKGFSENFTDKFVTVLPSNYEINTTSTKAFDLNPNNKTEIETLDESDFVQVTNTPEFVLFEQNPTIEVSKNDTNLLEKPAYSLRNTTEQNKPMSTLHTSQLLSNFTINITDTISTIGVMNQINENVSTPLNDNTFVYNEAQTVATNIPLTTIGSATDSLSPLQGQTEIAFSSKRSEIRTSNLPTMTVGENKESFSTPSLLEISTAFPPIKMKIGNIHSSTDYISPETTGIYLQTTTQKLISKSIDEYSTTEISPITNITEISPITDTDSAITTKHSSTGFVVSNEGQPETTSKFNANDLITQSSVITPHSDLTKPRTSTSHIKIEPTLPNTVLEIHKDNLIATTEILKHSDVPTDLFDKFKTSLHFEVPSTTDAPDITSTSNLGINTSATKIPNQVFITNSYPEKENNPLENVILNNTSKLEANIQESVASTIRPSLNLQPLNTRDKKLGEHETIVNNTDQETIFKSTIENAKTNNNDSDLISQTNFFTKNISENLSNKTNKKLSDLPIESNEHPTVLTTLNNKGTIHTLLEEYDSSKILNIKQERAKPNLNLESVLSTAIPNIDMLEEIKFTSGTSTPSTSVKHVTYSTQKTHQSNSELSANKQSISQNPTIESQRAIKFKENKLHQMTTDTSLTSNKLLQHEGKDNSSNTSYLLENSTVKATVGGGSLRINTQTKDILNLTKPLVIDIALPLDLDTKGGAMAKNFNGISVVSTIAMPTAQAIESSATVIPSLTKASDDPTNTKQKPFELEAFKTDVTIAMNTERYPEASSTPSVRLESRTKKMETVSDANDTNQPDKRSVNMNPHVTIASTVTASNLKTKNIESIAKMEKLGSSQTTLSLSSPDFHIATQQIAIGSDVVIDENMESEKTHSGIISFLTITTKSRETKEKKEDPEDKESNTKERSETPIHIHEELGTISATNESNNNVQKELIKREEILINTENKDIKSKHSINIEVLSPKKIKTDKNINYGMHIVKDGNKNQTPTYTSTENSTASMNESHKSNSISKDQNNTSYQADNNTVISNDQSSTPRYKPKINTTATRDTQTTAFPALESTTRNTKSNDFSCKHKKRGRYADQRDCKKFYICVGNKHVVEGTCPSNTVFSDIIKQCTKNLSHCIRNNQFRCVTEGRFSDFRSDNVYYICVKNNNHLNAFIRFKLLCLNGYRLNKTSVRCVLNDESSSQQSTSKSDSSSSISDQSGSLTKQDDPEETTEEPIKKFKCNKEGIFPDPKNCRKYYECRKTGTIYRQKRKKCDSGEIFHKDKKKCVDSDSYE